MKVAVVARLKNAILYDAAKKVGSARQLAIHLGVHPTEVGKWMNFGAVPSILRHAPGMAPPMNNGHKRDWDALESKLLLLTGHTLDEIFPEEVRGEKFLKQQKRIETILEISVERLMSAGAVPQLAPAPDDILFREDKAEALREALTTLTPREEIVLKMRFGLGGNEEMTLAEVGQHFNLTAQRIRMIEAKALRKLRHPSRARGLKPFIGNEALPLHEYVLAPATGEAELISTHEAAVEARREEEWAQWRAERQANCVHEWRIRTEHPDYDHAKAADAEFWPIRCMNCHVEGRWNRMLSAAEVDS